MKPQVSVIIPTKDRAALLGRALESVLRQTYQGFEIIVIDDNSLDNTGLCVHNYRSKDARIKYLKNGKNLGGSASRNAGIRNSQGSYVAFLDDDDIWLPEKLDEQMRLAKDSGCKFVTCGRRNESGEFRKNVIPPGIITLERLFRSNVIGSASAVLVEKSVFEKTGLFDENLKSAQDWDMWVRILKSFPVCSIRKPLYINNAAHSMHRITTDRESRLQGTRYFFDKYKNEMGLKSKEKFAFNFARDKIDFEKNSFRKILHAFNFFRRSPLKRSLWFGKEFVKMFVKKEW